MYLFFHEKLEVVYSRVCQRQCLALAALEGNLGTCKHIITYLK